MPLKLSIEQNYIIFFILTKINKTYIDFFFDLSFINFNLQNGLMLIHPILLYYSYVLLFIFFLRNFLNFFLS